MTQRIGNLAVEMTLEGFKFRRDLQAATRDMRSSTARINRSLTSIDKTSMRVSRSIARFTKAFGALAVGYVTQRMARDFLRIGIYAERMEKGLQAATGSMEAANRASEFLKQTSEELGLVYLSQVESYRKLAAAARGSALEGETIREVYRSIVEASTALQLSQQDVEGALYAITQMISKGKVSMEELRRQLGERLPGAFRIAAEAMGMTTMELDKFISDGNLMVEDFLPRFAAALRKEYAGAWQSSADSAQSNINRLITSWQELQTTVMESGVLEWFTERIKDVNTELKEWIKNGRTLSGVLNGLSNLVEVDPAEWWRRGYRHPGGPMPQSSESAFRGMEMREYGGARNYFGSRGGGARPPATAGGGGGSDAMPYLAVAPFYDRAMIVGNMVEPMEKAIKESEPYFEQFEDYGVEAISGIQRAADSASWGMQSAFTTFFDASSEGFMSLQALGLDVLSTLQRAASQALVQSIFGAISGGIGGGFGGSSPWLGTVGPGLTWGGGRASGGPVLPGRAYMVGENGPEMFTPGAAGSIEPNGGNNYYIINAVDVQSFEDRYRGSITKITAEELNDNNGALWGALARR